MRPLYVYASEVAACIGENPYKPVTEAIACILKRYDPDLYDEKGITTSTDVAERVLSENPELKLHLSGVVKSTKTLDQVAANLDKAKVLVPDSLSAPDMKAVQSHIRSAVYTSLGTNCENDVYERLSMLLGEKVSIDDKLHKKKMGTLSNGVDWYLCGRVDAMKEDGTIVEIKNRVKRLFMKVPEYERVQILCYMHLTGAARGLLVEAFRGEHCVHAVSSDAVLWEAIEKRLAASLENIFL